jgi:hypothetical protein
VKIALRLAAPTLVAIAAIVASGRDARALGPVDVEIGARVDARADLDVHGPESACVGVGTNPDSKGPNPFGLGLGGRAGVSIFHIYGGLSAIHYFGSSSDIPTPAGTINSSYSSTLLGVEAGYSITAVPHLTLRPQLGIGSAPVPRARLRRPRHVRAPLRRRRPEPARHPRDRPGRRRHEDVHVGHHPRAGRHPVLTRVPCTRRASHEACGTLEACATPPSPWSSRSWAHARS